MFWSGKIYRSWMKSWHFKLIKGCCPRSLSSPYKIYSPKRVSHIKFHRPWKNTCMGMVKDTTILIQYRETLISWIHTHQRWISLGRVRTLWRAIIGYSGSWNIERIAYPQPAETRIKTGKVSLSRRNNLLRSMPTISWVPQSFNFSRATTLWIPQLPTWIQPSNKQPLMRLNASWPAHPSHTPVSTL